jgi:hypothetical protein
MQATLRNDETNGGTRTRLSLSALGSRLSAAES